MDLAPAHGGFRRQTGRLNGDVEIQLQAHAAGQHPTIEITWVAEPVAIDPNKPEEAAGKRRYQKALDCLAGESSRRAPTAPGDRGARRTPRRQSHGGPPKSSIAVGLSRSSLSGCHLCHRSASVGRADSFRGSLELVWSGNEAVEPSHRAAVILRGDAFE